MSSNKPFPLDYEAGDVAVPFHDGLAHRLIMSVAALLFVGALVGAIALLAIPAGAP